MVFLSAGCAKKAVKIKNLLADYINMHTSVQIHSPRARCLSQVGSPLSCTKHKLPVHGEWARLTLCFVHGQWTLWPALSRAVGSGCTGTNRTPQRAW